MIGIVIELVPRDAAWETRRPQRHVSKEEDDSDCNLRTTDIHRNRCKNNKISVILSITLRRVIRVRLFMFVCVCVYVRT